MKLAHNGTTRSARAAPPLGFENPWGNLGSYSSVPPYQQYFPTIENASEGGYGADPGVSTAEVGAGEQMMNAALIQLYRMRGKYQDMPWEGSK